MAFIKTNWRIIVFGVVVVASLAGAGWGVMSQSEIEAKMRVAQEMGNKVRGLAGGAVNKAIIEEKLKENEERKRQIEAAEQIAFQVQLNNPFYERVESDGSYAPSPRTPLVPNVLPKSASDGDRVEFRTAYSNVFSEIMNRLHAADKPSTADVQIESDRLRQSGGESRRGPQEPWTVPLDLQSADTGSKIITKLDALRSNAASVAAYKRAKEIWMYVSEGAIDRHPLAKSTSNPTDEEIWHAQMSLWIQQDLLAGLTKCNDARAAELRKAGQTDRLWVAFMPVKHLKALAIDRKLGKGGGGSNIPKNGFPTSMTGKQNTPDMFVVQCQLVLVVEEAMLPKVLEEITRTGFYTPILVNYSKVPPNPKQENYLYGQDPVIEVTIDLEGYYFRKVYDQWLPESLKQVMSTPGAGATDATLGAPGMGTGFRGGRG